MAVTTNADEFVERMQIRAEQIRRNAERTVRATALAIDAAVVTASPVDTGRFRANWLPSVGVERFDVVDVGHAEDTSGAIAGYQIGDVIYLQNNLPYARRLNQGHSAQAPAAFVERAVRAGEQVVRQSRLFDDGGA